MHLLHGGFNLSRNRKLGKTVFVPFNTKKFESHKRDDGKTFFVGREIEVNSEKASNGIFGVKKCPGYITMYILLKEELVVRVGKILVGAFSDKEINRPISEDAENHIYGIFEKWKKDPVVFNAEIESNIAENNLIQQKEEEEKERIKEEQKRKAEEKYRDSLNRAKTDFLNGEFINADMFVGLCKQNNIDLPLRTHGFLNSHVIGVSLNQYKTYRNHKSTVLFKYIAELKNVLQESGKTSDEINHLFSLKS